MLTQTEDQPALTAHAYPRVPREKKVYVLTDQQKYREELVDGLCRFASEERALQSKRIPRQL
jgi:hypothetical protein